MNLRKVWTEIFQKPAGRLVLFLLVGGLFFTLILFRRAPSPKSENKPDSQQATTATGYSFQEDIPPTTRTRSASQSPPTATTSKPTVVTPKPPLPIPQTIFALSEPAHSESYLPYGRLLRCELVNTVDSINIHTPIIGLVLKDVWHNGQLIIPAGVEVHGVAQKVATRERIGSDPRWKLVFLDGRELPLSGIVLDYAPVKGHPDRWTETDGSAGLHGYLVKSDKLAEAKAILASMISAGAGAFPQTTNLISPLTGETTQIQKGGFQDTFAAEVQAGAQIYSQRLLSALDKDPYYVRVPAGTLFYLYVTQTVDLEEATAGLSVVNSTTPAK